VTLLSSLRNKKKRKEEEKGNLPSNFHFYHHLEAPLVGAFLKLPTLEIPMDFMFLEL
jgi:hypothetical protein